MLTYANDIFVWDNGVNYKMTTNNFKKVLIFSQEFPPQSGGAGTYVFELANGISKIGHAVTLLVGYEGKSLKTDSHLDKKIKVKSYNFDSKFWFTHWHNYLEKICATEKFDLLIIANYTAIISASKLDKIKLPPYFLTIHGADIDYFFGNTRHLKHYILFSRKKIINLFNNAKKIIAVSNYLKNDFLKYNINSKNCHTVYHGIDLNKFSDLRLLDNKSKSKQLNPRINDDDFVILCVARLAEDKGHDILILAMKEVILSFPNAKLFFVGDGPLRKDIEDMIIQNNLINNVFLVGAIDRKNINYFYSECDIFTMVSRRKAETFGIVYLEAMAFKKPIIAAEYAAVPEIIMNKINGFLVEPTSAQKVAEKIIYLFKNKEIRIKMGLNGFELLNTKFNNVEMAKNTMKLLQTSSNK